jgi:hypothetical protein
MYLVKYDDGMLVQDHLVVPWSYLSTALMSTDPTPSVTKTEPVSASAASPSAKSLGKRCTSDVNAEDTVEVPPLAPAVASAAAAMREAAELQAVAAYKRSLPVESYEEVDCKLKMKCAEQKYGDLLDSIEF